MDTEKQMTADEMKSIRLEAGYKSQKAFGKALDRSERWVHYRESGEVIIDKLEAAAIRTFAKNKKTRK